MSLSGHRLTARFLDLTRQKPRQGAEVAAAEIRRALSGRHPEAGRAHAVEAARATRSSRVRVHLGELHPYTGGLSISRPVREATGKRRVIREGDAIQRRVGEGDSAQDLRKTQQHQSWNN
ncbi:MAG: hypothetical protein QG671_2807 [Actinomycetota bacterium]|nr:hypothetical protein [Actinomycetota bacterium]